MIYLHTKRVCVQAVVFHYPITLSLLIHTQFSFLPPRPTILLNLPAQVYLWRSST